VQQVDLCCECGTVGESDCAAGGFVLCVWDSWGSECAAGGFVLFVCGTVAGVIVQQVALCCECGTVGE
jgi:hypothetical protein